MSTFYINDIDYLNRQTTARDGVGATAFFWHLQICHLP